MNESVLKTMIAAVDEVVKSCRSDFFKYDLKELVGLDNPEFLWSVRSTGTSLMIIDGNAMMKRLRNNEAARFRFMQFPNEQCDSFLYFKPEKVFHCKNEIIIEIPTLGYENDVREIYEPVHTYLTQAVADEFGEAEAKYWWRSIPIKFSSLETRRMVLSKMRAEGGESLINCLDGFRRWSRLAVDEQIVISPEFGSNSDFYFAQIRNGSVVMNGGILFYDGKWHRHT